ncbi:sugar O-acetyltransferase [Martelella mangrovi]|uniref:Maltose O-acetyltransferase n=1 Tax=Martelella mangrovi TaxID=1397477 RepID=A0ABV2ICF9_9HYPH
MTEKDRMLAGEWYCCLEPELDRLRAEARNAVHEHNTLSPDRRGALGPLLSACFAGVGEEVFVEAPFHCSYGFNIRLADQVYINAGCTILDSGRVEIGEGTMLGPSVQIYCAEHHRDAERRRAGEEVARPVSIGRNVWIGGGAIILGGVSIGDAAIVGAGAVVTRDVAAGSIVAGNPARPLR